VIERRVVHLLRWFEKTSEWLVGEEPLRRVAPEELRQLLELAADDPIYNVYPVGEREAAWLQPRIVHVFDRDAYVYVVEAQQLEVAADPVAAPFAAPVAAPVAADSVDVPPVDPIVDPG
jgi:hypothetical protein